MISQSTKTESNNLVWDLYEQHIIPPSSLIMRNKITLYIKTTQNPKALNHQLFNSFDSNFLAKEIDTIQLLWGFSIPDILFNYKGEKLVPKQAIKILLASRWDKILAESLLNSTWNVNEEEQPPKALLLTNPNPSKRLLQVRVSILHPSPQTGCLLCNTQCTHPSLHCIFDCPNILKVVLRESMWTAIRNHDPNFESFLKSLTQMQCARVMTGLQQIGASTSTATMLAATQEILCQICYDSSWG